jgi:hypothetical protein
MEIDEAVEDNFPVVGEPCDGCGGDGIVRAIFGTGSLVFCIHCWNRHETALRATATKVRG